MQPLEGLTFHAPLPTAQGIQNVSETASFSGLTITRPVGSARITFNGSVSLAITSRFPEIFAPQPTAKGNKTATATNAPFSRPSVSVPSHSTRAVRKVTANSLGATARISSVLVPQTRIVQDGPASVPFQADELQATIRQGNFKGLKVRGSGDVGFVVMNPRTGQRWFTSNDITWSQVDFFIVAAGGDVTKDFSYLAGWEKLVTQAFMDAVPSGRKMQQCIVSWSNNETTLRVYGGTETTLVMVYAR